MHQRSLEHLAALCMTSVYFHFFSLSSLLYLKIKQVVNGFNVSDSERFSYKTINESEIEDLLKNLDIKKASGIDTIPPKLVKLSADFLTPVLTKAINTSIAQNVFPENAKTASVIPLDKGKPNKNEMSNFRPVSVLNTFS